MSDPGKYQIVEGDLLTAKEDFICHQCNCVSTKSAGLASKVFQRFSFANVYRLHHSKGQFSTQGSIDLWDGNLEKGTRGVVNIYGQCYPGKANTSNDTKEFRLSWFIEGLEELLGAVKPGSSLAFPYGIGCGLAGGDWESYSSILESYAADPRIGKLVVYRQK